MLKQNWRLISRFERCGDIALIILCFFIAYYGRDSLIYWNDIFNLKIPFGGDALAPLKDYFLILVLGVFSFLVSLQALGAYSSMRLLSIPNLLRISIIGAAITFGVLSAGLFLLKIDLSRSFISLFCILVGCFLTLERLLILRLLRFLRRRGKNFRTVLITGLSDQALRVSEQIVIRPELGLRIKGFVNLKEGNEEADEANFRELLSDFPSIKTTRILSGVEECRRLIFERSIDEIIFTDVSHTMPKVEELVVLCSEVGVRTTVVANLFSLGVVHSGTSYFGDVPLIHFQTPPGDRWDLSVKRLIDVVLSGLALLVLSPVFLVLAIVVIAGDGAPVFFTQRRAGLNGRLFYLYKFRSMERDAAKKLEDLIEQNEMAGPVFKITDDPRITKAGKFLRRFSLDELPQLWNVLKGDMSIVGPRPPLPGEVLKYEPRDRRRLSMRPGITCSWQVGGRNEISDFRTWMKLDLEYIDNWSLWRDFILLFQTIPAVLTGKGAK